MSITKGTLIAFDETDDEFESLKEFVTGSSVVLQCKEEDSIVLNSGKLLHVVQCRHDTDVSEWSPVDFYNDLLETFNMNVADESPRGNWFGNADFYVAWKVDAGYQANKGVTFDEPAMIFGMSIDVDSFDAATAVKQYSSANEDYFDVGITESGKFFAVQKCMVEYFDALEFQKFLEEEINSKGE